MEGTCMKGVL